MIGRVTDDGDISDRHRRRRRRRAAAPDITGTRADPGARAHERRDRLPPARAAADTPAAGAGARRAGRGLRRAARARHGPRARAAGAARRPEPCQPRLGHDPVRRDRRCGHGRRERACGPRSCASGARSGRLVIATDACERVGALDPWLGAAMAVAECARNVAVTRGATAGCHELPQLRQPRAPGGVLAVARRRCAASATRAVRWACRSPAAMSASTTSRRCGAIVRRRPRSASSGCSTTWTMRVGPAFRAAGDVVLLAGGDGARSCRLHLCRARRARARRPAAAASTWRARRRSSASCGPPSGLTAASFRAGRERRRPRRGAGRVCHLGGHRRRPDAARGCDARRRALRRGSGARRAHRLRRADVDSRWPPWRREHGVAAAAASARPAATGSVIRLVGEGRHGRRRGARCRRRRRRWTSRSPSCATRGRSGCRARSATRSGSRGGASYRRPRHGPGECLCRRPRHGPGCPGGAFRTRSGRRLRCAASSASMPPDRKPRPSPPSACSRSSTAARNRQGSPSATAARSWSTRNSASWRRCSMSRACSRCAATGRSRTAATPRPAPPSGRTASRRCDSGRDGPSRSATTATSSTPASCSSTLPGGRSRLVGTHRHGPPHGAARRRPGEQPRGGARERAAARRRALLAGRHGRAAGHRRARPVRLPAARPGTAAARARWRHARVHAVRKRLGADPLGRNRARRTGRGVRRTHGWVLASETAALDTLGAEYVRDVEPGEMVVLGEPGGPRSVRFAEGREQLCVFELIYFARPDSYMLGRSLYEVRRRMGEELARRSRPSTPTWSCPCPTPARRPPPDTRSASGLPYREGMVQNRYAGRTFIQPNQSMRQRGVSMKLSPAARGRCAGGGWSSWTTRSCAARRRGRSWRCCGAPVPPRCICGSAPRRSTTPASTASTRRSRPS